MKTVLLLEGDGPEVVEDPMRTAYLEVWLDVDTDGRKAVPPGSVTAAMGTDGTEDARILPASTMTGGLCGCRSCSVHAELCSLLPCVVN